MNETLIRTEKALIYKAINNAMADIEAIGKNSKNMQQGFKFRGIDDVYNYLHGIFAKHKIFTITEVLEDKSEERQSKSGATLLYRILKIKYTVYAEDGSSVSGIVIGEGMDSGDKASNKAMAIAHKYFLTQLFIIPTLDQSDPDEETHEVKSKPKIEKPKESPVLPQYADLTDVQIKDKEGEFLVMLNAARDINELQNTFKEAYRFASLAGTKGYLEKITKTKDIMKEKWTKQDEKELEELGK
jgi:hypothetical protein